MIRYGTQVIAQTLDEAWLKVYSKLASDTEQQDSRAGSVVGEIIGASVVILDPRENIMVNSVRNLPMKYAVGELMWYLSGSKRLRDIEPYSKFWKKISDDGETLNSAYGYRIKYEFGFDQFEYVRDMLAKNPESRQAIIHIKEADSRPSKDVPCTIALQYVIRENKLHAITYMRSNDIWLGFPYDVFTFTCLQIKLAMELGIDVGTYTHNAGSLHLYERNHKVVDFHFEDDCFDEI